MSYALTGTRYIGSGTLPTPVVGYDAIDTSTGSFYVSNSSSTSWMLVGNVNSPNYGMMPVTGGVMTGSISGATGWAPLDSPDFTTTAKLNGLALATVNDLTTAITNVNAGISPKITSAVAATSNAISVQAKIARTSGTFTCTPVGTIGAGLTANMFNVASYLPTYPDGSQAAIGDCAWVISIVGIDGTSNGSFYRFTDGFSATTGTLSAHTVNPNATASFTCIGWDAVAGSGLQAIISYFIEGIKA